MHKRDTFWQMLWNSSSSKGIATRVCYDSMDNLAQVQTVCVLLFPLHSSNAKEGPGYTAQLTYSMPDSKSFELFHLKSRT